MARNVNDIIRKLPPARRKKIEARAAELIAEEMTLQQLRRARKITQTRLAKSLHIGQHGVSKIEQRTDLLLSTLRSCVKGMGGELHLIARFPDRPPVELTGFAAMENERRRTKEEKERAAAD
jgi:DNA-binding XRE family transcriptional regulator